MVLFNLSEAQTNEISAVFEFLDTDRDGLLSPRSALHLCEKLGFHPEPASGPGEPGSVPLSVDDFLSWMDKYIDQLVRDEEQKDGELRLAERYALLKSCDVFASAKGRLTRRPIEAYLTSEQHKVPPEVLDALMDEVGDGHSLSKQQFAQLIGNTKTAGRQGGGGSKQGGKHQMRR